MYVFLTLWGQSKKPYLCDLAKVSSECCPSDISQASFSSKARHMSVMWGASGFLGKHHVGGLSVNGLLVHILWSTWNYDWKPFDFSRWNEIQEKNGVELDFVRCKCIEFKKIEQGLVTSLKLESRFVVLQNNIHWLIVHQKSSNVLKVNGRTSDFMLTCRTKTITWFWLMVFIATNSVPREIPVTNCSSTNQMPLKAMFVGAHAGHLLLTFMRYI